MPLRCRSSVKVRAAAVGTPARSMTCWRVRLRGLEPGARRRRPEGGDPGVVQGIDHPGGQRVFGADDDQIDVAIFGEGSLPPNPGPAGIEWDGLTDGGQAGVPGCRDQIGEQGALGQLPPEDVLASPASEQQDPHQLPHQAWRHGRGRHRPR